MAGDISRTNGRKGGKPKGVKWKRTLLKEAAYQLYREEVLSNMAPIVQAQIESACGSYVLLGKTSDGQFVRVTDQATMDRLFQSGAEFFRLEQKEPDAAMSRYLTDQVIGKAKERLEVSGPDGGAIPIKNVVDVHEG